MMTKNETFNYLAHKNIARVVIGFSGGNDEGGPESTDAFDADGNRVELPEAPYVIKAYRGWNKDADGNPFPEGMPITTHGASAWRKATPEEIVSSEFRRALEQPIYDKYYSFAGDFYVFGTLVWDVPNRKVKLEGTEQVSQYEPFEEEV